MNRSMRLAELLPDVAGVPADLDITGLTLDSRDVRPGHAFVAIAGFGTHGLHFCAQARDAGAAAILFEPPAPEELPAPAGAIGVPGLRARMGAMADEFHGRGLGAVLVDTITTIAAASGVRKLQAMVLASNQRSRRLLSLVGLEVVRHDGGVLEAEGAFHLLERPQVNRSKVVRLAVPANPPAA